MEGRKGKKKADSDQASALQDPSASSDHLSDVRSEADPPSLSAQTKTADGADRKRIYRACEVCRRKKIRCDGLKPCKACVRMKESCVFLDDASKSTYSKKYVESLEQRLKRMENSLADGALRSPALEAASAGPSQPPTTAAAALISPSYLSSPGQGTGQGFHMSLVSLGSDEACNGRLQTDEAGNRRYIGPSAALGLLCDAASLALGPSAHSGLERSILPPSAELRILSGGSGVSLASVVPSYPSVDGLSLPPRDLAEALLRTFFDSIHPIFPILDERLTKSKCALIYEYVGSNQHGKPITGYSSSSSSAHEDRAALRSDPLFLATMFAVFACASRVLKDIRVCTTVPSAAEAENEGYADVFTNQFDSTSAGTSHGDVPPASVGPNFALAGLGFFERAQVLSLHRASDTRLEQVQCTALLALYMAANNCAARAWILCGTALRVAIDIGIHRAIMPLDMSVAELEMRRRVWFSVYSMDRLLGIALGRPLGIEDMNHDQMRPALSLENGHQKLMPGINLLIDLLQLEAHICRCVTRLNNARSRSDMDAVRTLRAQALDFESQLAAWLDRVPPHLQKGTSESGSPWDIQSVVLMATFHSAEMLLYRALILDAQKKAANTLTQEDDEVLAKATRTALRIIKLTPHMSTLAATHFTLEFAQQLLVAATFLGLNAYRHGGSNAQTLFSQAEEGIYGLRLLEPSFPGARNLRKALSRVIRALRQKCGITPVQSAATSKKRERSETGTIDGPQTKRRPSSHSNSAVPTSLSSNGASAQGNVAGHATRHDSPSSSGSDDSSRRSSVDHTEADPHVLPGLSFQIFAGTNTTFPTDVLKDTGAAFTSTPSGTNTAPSASTSSTTNLMSATPVSMLPEHLDTATLCSDFQFDGGFDPFAALELFSTYDLSALLGQSANVPGSTSFTPSMNQ
ncbi:hypothetical protein A4X13_0g5233 [Tilletia indica]|uniref:Uncharacterized protein n=1 Tax=Tilletia indica TaxID=43049 RepID=A0A177TI31_9BASI|nr:hypothetical protein A4X13_0g5233 [Tilletia indica]